MLFGSKSKPYQLPRARDGEPLTAVEMAPVWALERQVAKGYIAAMLIFLVGVLGQRYFSVGGETYRALVLLASLGALLVAGVLQRRMRCPRCAAPVGRKILISLPAGCKACGVAFPKAEVAPTLKP